MSFLFCMYRLINLVPWPLHTTLEMKPNLAIENWLMMFNLIYYYRMYATWKLTVFLLCMVKCMHVFA